jgi:hypothetical protein
MLKIETIPPCDNKDDRNSAVRTRLSDLDQWRLADRLLDLTPQNNIPQRSVDSGHIQMSADDGVDIGGDKGVRILSLGITSLLSLGQSTLTAPIKIVGVPGHIPSC